MSTSATEAQKQESLNKRIHSYYMSCVRSNRHNRQSARDSTVKKFGISYPGLLEIIETHEAKTLCVDVKTYRIEKALERARKARTFRTLRSDLTTSGRITPDMDDARANDYVRAVLATRRWN